MPDSVTCKRLAACTHHHATAPELAPGVAPSGDGFTFDRFINAFGLLSRLSALGNMWQRVSCSRVTRNYHPQSDALTKLAPIQHTARAQGGNRDYACMARTAAHGQPKGSNGRTRPCPNTGRAIQA